MIVKMTVERKEIRGNQAVAFEVYDKGQNKGTLTVGKGGIRWQTPNQNKTFKAQSWKEVERWLEKHGRTVRTKPAKRPR